MGYHRPRQREERNDVCKYCGVNLDTDIELGMGICEGCAIDLYEEQQRKREQAYLEDDRNWEH